MSCAERTPVEQPDVAPAATSENPSATDTKQAEPAAAEPAPPTEETRRVALADDPDVDLITNRYRWHIEDEGLVIPFVTPGLRKYTQEYKRPLTDVVEWSGQRGRVMKRRAAKLTFPWSEGSGEATVRIWMNGLKSGQRVQVNINGKAVGSTSIEPGWTQVALEAKSGILRDGENDLLLQTRAKASLPGHSAYGLFQAIEIVPGDKSEGDAKPPMALVVSSGGKDVLGGVKRASMLVDVPDDSWFDATLVAKEAGKVSISATPRNGERVVLFEESVDAGESRPIQVDLAELSWKLVELEIEFEGGAVLEAPRLALEEAKIRARPEPFDNVILLVVDALRSDRLKLYGDSRVETPNFTTAGERAVVFQHNQAASPSSPPSHGSIQTGMIPRVHGVAADKSKLTPGTPMISTQAGDAGISTGYYGNNPFGMARLESPGKWTEFHQPNKEGKGIDCVALTEGILDFAKRQQAAGKRFFVSSLPYEPHTPYRYHEGISEKYHSGGWGAPVGKSVDGYLLGDLVSGKVVLNKSQWSQLEALYDGEVEHMDECFGQLEEGLKSLGLFENTAIVLTSDHGEGMFEHGLMGHAFGHYAELANVPFVIYAKGITDSGPRTVETVTTHLDIAPTVLDLLGVERSERIQGMSVLPLILRQGPWTPRVVSLEYGKSYGLRARDFKLIVSYGGTESLYDVAVDPTEQKDVHGSDPIALRYMRDMAGFFLEYRKAWRSETMGDYNNHKQGFIELVK